ncbi:AcrR family transcriptional regulator [Bradyrhizobium sp. USDA 328]
MHFAGLRVKLNNVHMSSLKMNNVQEESLRDQKKSRRRRQILEIARGIIAAKGLRSLKVRDVAEAVGCSVGSVYNEFGDFDGVILTVNRETVQALTARLRGVPAEDPVRQLYGLAETYLDFFAGHANLLRSLFEHRMEDDRPYPDDILQMVMDAFALMHPPLVRLLPDADDVKIALLSRTLFSAVHGIISLGLEERMVAVPPQMLRQQIEQFLDVHLRGLGILPQR